MADPLRTERVVLRDGRAVIIRPATLEDAAGLIENINTVVAEDVYILIDSVPMDLNAERRWLASFDGKRSALLVGCDGPRIVGQVDCHGGRFTKNRHVGTVGIAIRDGWREIGLGRILMGRILEWMRARGFLKAQLCVFATNVRATRLYESLGFQIEGARRQAIRIRGEFIDEIMMGLWLGERTPPRRDEGAS